MGRPAHRRLTHSVAIVAAALGFALPATAQTARDSGYVVLDTRLGGDSAQVTTANLRRGASYLVRVRSLRADIQVRRRSRDTTAARPLEQTPLSADSVTTWRSFRVTAGEGGEHFVELTNPGIGTTAITVSLLRRASGDTLATNERRTLVFSDNISGGPSFVSLDSGVVYRFIAVGGTVYISPRAMYRTPLRPAPIIHPGSTGTPYLTEFSGEYRIDGDGTDVSVRIYREEMDAVQVACLTNPRGPGCLGSRGRRGPRVGLILALISIPIAVAMLQGH